MLQGPDFPAEFKQMGFVSINSPGTDIEKVRRFLDIAPLSEGAKNFLLALSGLFYDQFAASMLLGVYGPLLCVAGLLGTVDGLRKS